MDVVFLSRLQFATTTIFHFLFVPLSICLALYVAIMETMYVRTGKEEYKSLAKFWGKLFLINFAVGIVTGILQEFQFGMNWSAYSRFVGDVFGAPLAIEALLAFFLESTFLGIWIFGWDRLSKKVHLLSIWLVFIGTTLSALWILAANSFMQHPVGYEINNGRAEMNDFVALLTNGQLLVEFPHTFFGALLTGAAFVFGVSAWKIAKKQNADLFKHTLKIAGILGLLGFFGVALSGHAQAQYLVKTQPMKMAATEAQWGKSGDPAGWNLFATIDTENQKNNFEINIPGMLSFLSYSKFSGEVKGILELQAEYVQKYGEGNYIPPVRTTFWSFRIMIAAGVMSFLLFAYGLYLHWKKKLDLNHKWFTKAALYGISLPFISNTAGWIMTEIGRQPWTVFGLMRTEDSVSPSVSAGQVLFSVITFTTIYAILGTVMVYLFVKVIKKGPFDQKPDAPIAQDPFNDSFKKGGSHVVS
ncbi:cytochrome ubiquinol oxidase subunit I [Gorillibacterium timonense]|uniref:cytochrome ubiquinol oxidase subunit I n=1 Tax=Gorillibacterium timonense TaxID=1689269 RepID=UPI00071CB42C|nr:cytochrome ubiquinol oxidase subunit I [Gorillibacterium timonense]